MFLKCGPNYNSIGKINKQYLQPMGEECSIKIWTLGLHVELASYKPRIDPVLTMIIAILLPTQNVELSSTSLLKPSPPPPHNPALHQPRLFSKQTYQ